MQPPSDSEVREAKTKLREQAKLRRATLTPRQRTEGSAALARQGLGFLKIAPQPTVSGFLSIGEEINPGPLMLELQRQGMALALPAMVGKLEPLSFRAWKPGDPLVSRMWGIREPTAAATETEPDVLLVPLLAFDRTGHRLGYGGGYYDRTLRWLRRQKTIVAVGVAFAIQEVDAVPHLDYDERLDWILTPEGPISRQP